MKTFSALFLTAVMMVGAFAQNLVENSSFENGVSLWSPPGWKRPDARIWLAPVWDKANSQGAGGTASLKLDWTNKHICYVWYKKEMPLNGMKEVEFSFWAKSAGYEDVSIIEMSVEFPGIKDPKKKNVNLGSKWNRPPKEWTCYSKVITVPEGAANAKLCIRIHGFKSRKGTSWIDNVYFGPVQKKADEPKAKNVVTLKRGVPVCDHGGIYYPGEQMTYSVEFKENSAPGKKMDFSWEIQDFDGKKVAEGKQTVTLPSAKEGAFQIKLPVLKDFRGWFALKGKFTENGRTVSEMLSSGVIVEKQQGKRDPFYSAKDPGTIEKQIRMGNGSSNYHAQRRIMQSGPDSLDPKAEKRLKNWLEMCEKNGFEPYIIFHISQYTTPNNQQQPLYMRKMINDKLAKGIYPYDEAYFRTWKNYFAQLAKISNGKVRDWYIGDEIYNVYHRCKWEVPHYVGVQKALYETIKKIDPAMMVAGGGTFMDKDPLGKRMWPQVKDYLDGLSCSLYLGKGTVAKGVDPDGPETGKLVERFKDTRSVIGQDTFITGTESGYCFLDFPELDSEKVKDVAKINARNLVILKAMNVRKWIYFMFENDPSCESARRGYGRTDWGMWNRKWGSPKPHAATWAVSARVLAFVSDPVDASPCPDIYCYVFKKGKKTLAAFWAYSKEDVDAEINMPSDWSGMDFLGRPFSGKKGIANLKLNDRVLYLEFDAPQETVANAFRKGKYVLPEAYVAINRINGGKVGVSIKNKTTGDLKAEVSLNGCPSQKIVVKHGTIGTAAFANAPGTGKLSAAVNVNGVKYHAEKEDEWYMVKKLSVPPLLQGNQLKGFEKVKPLVMDSMKHIKPAEIETHGIWTGKDDLSAKIYLGYDKDNFYLGAEITDDVHISRYSGQLAWNQDAMQFAFDMGNNDYDLVLSPGGYGDDDREFVLSATPKGPQLFCFTGPADVRRKLIGTPQVVRNGNKTLYFVKLPWTLLGKQPVKGNVFGFNAVIFDFDKPDATISCQLEFSPGITYGKTPALFKRFILE